MDKRRAISGSWINSHGGPTPPNKAILTQQHQLGRQLTKRLSLTTAYARVERVSLLIHSSSASHRQSATFKWRTKSGRRRRSAP
jgi:hypothetical protein